MTMENLNRYIDHTILKPEATEEDIAVLCKEAIRYRFQSVCVNPSRVAQAFELLKGSGVLVCTVIGFPLGANTTSIKCAEGMEAVKNGAEEVDMVIPLGAVKERNWDYVKQDIAAVVEAVVGKAIVKVILETCLLTQEEIIKACLLAKEAGAHFVKTSTGFSQGGATAEAVSLMRKTVGDGMGVKASGGIRDKEKALKMIAAGASRIGTSAGVAIMEGREGK